MTLDVNSGEFKWTSFSVVDVERVLWPEAIFMAFACPSPICIRGVFAQCFCLDK